MAPDTRRIAVARSFGAGAVAVTPHRRRFRATLSSPETAPSVVAPPRRIERRSLCVARGVKERWWVSWVLVGCWWDVL